MSTRSRVDEASSELARTLAERPDVDATLRFLTASAVKTVPGFDIASVSVREADQRIRTMAPTSDLANKADELQYELREGPCYDVLHGERSTLVKFMRDETRWPNFAPRADSLGVGSMMSFELADRPGWRAGLNLYSSQGGSFDPDAVSTAELFATHAAVTLGFVQKIDELESGLRTRTSIGQAVGILMERYAITHDRAFGFLVRVSSQTNVKLRDIAADVVEETENKADQSRTDASLFTI